jgi:hypothetical protein
VIHEDEEAREKHEKMGFHADWGKASRSACGPRPEDVIRSNSLDGSSESSGAQSFAPVRQTLVRGTHHRSASGPS